MPHSITIESANRSVRWYLTPGEQTTYDLAVSNPGVEPIHCVLTLDEPPNGGALEPSAFTLAAGETRNAELTFRPDAQASRDQLAVITARDENNLKVGEFQITLISAGGTDCTTALAWKEMEDASQPPAENGKVREFVLGLSVKSLSQSEGEFPVDFSPHPALEFPSITPLHLWPGQSANVDVPVRWHSDVSDEEGLNHPRAIEVGVAVSQGRRSSRLLWEVIERKLYPEAEPAPEVGQPSESAPEQAPAPTPVAVPPVSAFAATEAPPEPALAHLPVAPALQAPVTQLEGLEDSVVGLPRRGYRPYDLPEDVPPQPVRLVTETPIVQPPPRESRSRLPTLISVGFAAIILAVVLVFYLPRPNQSSVATTAVIVTAQPTIEAMVPATVPKPPPKNAKTTAKATAPASTAQALATAVATALTTPAAVTPAPTSATHKSVALSAAQNPHVRQRPAPVDRSAIVAMEGISARYGPRGRAVRVVWAASSQASAHVQVLDDRGAVISSTGVRGQRQSALLYLPRSYHGAVYVQVVSVGFQGERVTQSTSLPPF